MTPEMPLAVAVVSTPPMLHPVSLMAEFVTLAEMPMPPRHFPWVLPLDTLGCGRRGPQGHPDHHCSQQCSDPSHALLPRLAPRAM